MKDRVVITSTARTAIGKFGGSLKDVDPVQLASYVIKEAVRRAQLRPQDIDRIVLGQNMQLTRGGNPARRAHLAAGLPVEIDDYTLNMNCASGLRAVVCAAQDILLDEVSVCVAGGMENMSQAPYLLEKARFGYRLGNGVMVDFLADYILGDAGPMAERVAREYAISRERQDAFALQSHQKAIQAQDEGRFKDEIVPVTVTVNREEQVFDVDEHPRRDTSLEKLARLRPAFAKDGTVTSGNSSGINDGAAAVTLMSEKRARELGCTPLAAIRGWASAGLEPDLFGMGPVPAVERVLQKTGLRKEDLELVELNEAFASSTLACIDELELDPSIVNVNGGAIALGHPVGATGVILLIKLVGEMKRRGATFGLVTMCIGSGQGMAVVLESVNSQ